MVDCWSERGGSSGTAADLLSPDSAFVELATDKTQTARTAGRGGRAGAAAVLLQPGRAVSRRSSRCRPCLKPNDGVGCLETHWCVTDSAARQLAPSVPGRATRGGVLRRPAGQRPGHLRPAAPAAVAPLPAAHLVRRAVPVSGRHVPARRASGHRACQLARAAFAALPRTRGFVGVDMVLGAAADGSDDVVLEVNPRLTTSYIGLRQGTASNLAAAMLAIQRGDRCPLFFHSGAVEFEADGRIRQTGHLGERRVMNWLALDIGGANLKVADGQGFAASHPFALWKDKDRLAWELRSAIAESPPHDHLVVTMTGELADCFASKVEGVKFILQAVHEAADGRHTRVYLVDGTLVSLNVALTRPLLAASANWHALACFCGRFAAAAPGLADRHRLDDRRLHSAAGWSARRAAGDDRHGPTAGRPVGLYRHRTQPGVRSGADAPVSRPGMPRGAGSVRHHARCLFAARATCRNRPTIATRPIISRPRAMRPAGAWPACSARTNCSSAWKTPRPVPATSPTNNWRCSCVRPACARAACPRSPPLAILSGHGEFLARRLLAALAWQGEIISLVEKLGPIVSRCAPAHALAVLAKESTEH